MELSGHIDRHRDAEFCHIAGYKKLQAKYSHIVDLYSFLVPLALSQPSSSRYFIAA